MWPRVWGTFYRYVEIFLETSCRKGSTCLGWVFAGGTCRNLWMQTLTRTMIKPHAQPLQLGQESDPSHRGLQTSFVQIHQRCDSGKAVPKSSAMWGTRGSGKKIRVDTRRDHQKVERAFLQTRLDAWNLIKSKTNPFPTEGKYVLCLPICSPFSKGWLVQGFCGLTRRYSMQPVSSVIQ